MINYSIKKPFTFIYVAPVKTTSKCEGRVILEYVFIEDDKTEPNNLINRGFFHLTRKSPYEFEGMGCVLQLLRRFSMIFTLANGETVPSWFLEVQEILKKQQPVLFLPD